MAALLHVALSICWLAILGFVLLSARLLVHYGYLFEKPFTKGSTPDIVYSCEVRCMVGVTRLRVVWLLDT